jgi:3-dehydroquinate dehydratase / shikimate dehydrogenase
MSRATLVATISSLSRGSNKPNGPDWKLADWLEIRADLMPDPDPITFRPAFNGRLLYSLRSCSQGGGDDSSNGARHRRLRRAAGVYDLVELEGDRDLVPELLSRIAPERRVISWRGKVRDEQALQQLLQAFSRTGARLYRFELGCVSVEEGVTALQFLHDARRSDVVAYAAGSLGLWTRVLAPRLGAPIVFGGLTDECEDGTDGLLSELVHDYGFPDIHPVSEIYAIVGKPVACSLSPRLHNAAHRASGTGRLFLSFPTQAFGRLWSRLVSSGNLEATGLTIKGLTVASPHKESALEVSGRVAPLCYQCKATNLLVRQNGTWTAFTTEPEGILYDAIFRRIDLTRARVAVVGCGGSGRVTAAVLAQAGAEVTLVNRGIDRGSWAGRLLGLRFVPLKEFSLRGYSALVNATPVGRAGEELPIDLEGLDPGSLVVDMVYSNRGMTPLVAVSRALGHQVIEGRKVLLAQTMRQYNLMTGEQMPEGLARRLLELPVTGNGPVESVHPDRTNAKAKAEPC